MSQPSEKCTFLRRQVEVFQCPETSPSALARFLPTPTTPFVHEASKFRVQSTFRVTACCEGTPTDTSDGDTAGAFGPTRLERARGELPCVQLENSLLLFGCGRVEDILAPSAPSTAISMSMLMLMSMSMSMSVERVVHSWTCLGIHLTRLRGRAAPLPLATALATGSAFWCAESAPERTHGQSPARPQGNRRAVPLMGWEHSHLLPQVDDLPLPAWSLEFGVWSGHPTQSILPRSVLPAEPPVLVCILPPPSSLPPLPWKKIAFHPSPDHATSDGIGASPRPWLEKTPSRPHGSHCLLNTLILGSLF